MFGFFRNRKKKKLKETLLEQGKLDSYGKKFEIRIKELEKSMKHYVNMAKIGKEQEDQSKIIIGIKYSRIIEENITKLRNLQARLDMARLGSSTQNAYNEFVDAVAVYTKELKTSFGDDRAQKKTLQKHGNVTEDLAGHIEMIESQLEQIDQNMSSTLMDGELSKAEVDSFFSRHE